MQGEWGRKGVLRGRGLRGQRWQAVGADSHRSQASGKSRSTSSRIPLMSSVLRCLSAVRFLSSHLLPYCPMATCVVSVVVRAYCTVVLVMPSFVHLNGQTDSGTKRGTRLNCRLFSRYTTDALNNGCAPPILPEHICNTIQMYRII